MAKARVPTESGYTAPGVAVIAPRVKLTSLDDVADGTRVRFEPAEGIAHLWAPSDTSADLALIATVDQSTASLLRQDGEYFIYVVPVDAMVPPD